MGPPPPKVAPPSPYPLDVGRVAALGWSLYRHSWSTLLVTSALCMGPAFLLMAGVAALFEPRVNQWLTALEIATRSGLDPPAMPAGFDVAVVSLLAAGIVTFLAATLAAAAIIRVVDTTYRGEAISSRQAVRDGLRRLPALIAAQLLYLVLVILIVLIGVAVAAPLVLSGGLAAFFGLVVAVASVVAVLFVGVRTTLVAALVVIERAGGAEALARSWRMTSGSGWRLFGYLILAGLLIGLLGVVLSAVPVLLLGLRNTVPAHVAANALIQGIGGIIAAPLLPILTSLLYYDLRWRSGAPTPVPGTDQPAPAPSPRTF